MLRFGIRCLAILFFILANAGTDVYAQTSRQRKAKTQQTASKTGTKKGSGSKKSAAKKGQGKSATIGKGKKETSADVKKREEATRREIAKTKERIVANEKQIRSGLAELSRVNGDLQVTDRKVKALDSKVASLSSRIKGLEVQIEDGKREVERMRSEYLKAVKKMRLTRHDQSMLAFVFSADSFNQGLRRMRYLKRFSAWKSERSKEIMHRTEVLTAQAKELEDARLEEQDALSKQQAARKKLAEQSRRQDALVANLRSEGDALNSHLAKKQAEANQLKSQIATLIAAEQRAAEEQRRKEEAQRKAEAERKAVAEKEAAEKEEAQRKAEAAAKASEQKSPARKEKPQKEKSKTKKETAKPAKDPKKETKASKTKPEPQKTVPATPANAGSGFSSQKGSLPKPVDGHFRVTSPFGRHSLPELPDVVYDNPGIDVEVQRGAVAKAVFAGKVSGVYMIPGFGNVVIVNHGNHYTVYGNLASVSVKVGDEVSQGKSIGKVADDPDNSSYGQLHFEVWQNRDKLNPLNWIR